MVVEESMVEEEAKESDRNFRREEVSAALANELRMPCIQLRTTALQSST